MNEPQQETQQPRLVVPPKIQRILSPVGAHRRGLKVMWYGSAKTGKSFAAASMPHPIFAMDGGEGGIQPYLDPSKGDVCVVIEDQDDFIDAVNFAVDSGDHFRSIIEDPITTIYQDYLDGWTGKIHPDDDYELGGADWKKVKPPWKRAHKRLMRSHHNLSVTAHMKDVLYEQVEGNAPGMKAKLNIRQIEGIDAEKKTPYVVDLIFVTHAERDSKDRPTGIHTVTFMGGRRPKSIAPTDLYIGKKWKFDSKKPESVWDKIVAPLDERWVEGAVDFLGVDPTIAKDESDSAQIDWMDGEVGRLLLLIDRQTDIGLFAKAFREEIEGPLNGLTGEHRRKVLDAKEKKKAELSAPKS